MPASLSSVCSVKPSLEEIKEGWNTHTTLAKLSKSVFLLSILVRGSQDFLQELNLLLLSAVRQIFLETGDRSYVQLLATTGQTTGNTFWVKLYEFA